MPLDLTKKSSENHRFFKLYHVTIRPTKIIKELLKDCKILIFKVIFQLKIIGILLIFLIKEYQNFYI
jgi:hypothetical protein